MGFSWRTTLGFALSAALVYWVLRGQHWGDVADALRGSSVLLWAVTTVVSQLVFPLRAIRWVIILHPVAPQLGFGPSWRATTIGMMINNVVPARIGELARAFVLTREEPRVPFTTALGSLVLDRAFDALVVLLLLLVAVLDPAFGTETEIGGKALGALIAVPAAGVVVGFTVLFAAAFKPEAIERVAGAVTHRLARRYAGRVQTLARNITTGFAVLRDPRRFASIFFWTLLHWVVNSLAFWLGMIAMGLDAPFSAAVLTQGLIAVAVALPQAPGYFGTFEATAIATLGLYGIARADGLAWAVTFHLLSFIPIVLIGAWYFARAGLRLADLRGSAPAGDRA